MIRLPHFCLRSYKLLAQVAPLSALVIVELWFTSFGCTKMGQRIVVTIMSFFCFLNPKPKDRDVWIWQITPNFTLRSFWWVPMTDIDSHKLLKQRWNNWGNVQYLMFRYTGYFGLRKFLGIPEYQVIPNISGYLIPDVFEDWIRSGQVLKTLPKAQRTRGLSSDYQS